MILIIKDAYEARETTNKIAKLKKLKNWKDVLLNKVELDREIKKEVAVFEDKKKTLLESMCKKDESGNPVIENNKYCFEDGEEDKALVLIKELAEEFEKTEVTLNLRMLNLSDFDHLADEYEIADLLAPLVGTLINGN